MTSRPVGAALPTVMLALVALGGCSKAVDNQTVANNAANATVVGPIDDRDSPRGDVDSEAAAVPTDDWVGRWVGPEGLFLDIQPSPDGQPGHYAITNRDTLDREASYAGTAEGASISFNRDGKHVSIRPGSGEQTGFKYLAGKSNCLIVEPGKEGYCR